MRTIKELRADLAEKSNKHLGFNLNSFPQRSPEWMKARLGVITASEVNALTKEGRKKGSLSTSWETYQLTLISEIITGESRHAHTTAMDWGNAYENEARELFAFESMYNVDELTFCFTDNMRCGASVDLIIESVGNGEIKCPYNTSNHLEFLLDDTAIDRDYLAQMQFQMWVIGSDLNHFISYDPRAKSKCLKYIEVKKDNETFDLFEERVPLFIEQMDEKLEKLNIKWGDQWEC